jgi:hypothetical protein
MFNSRNQVISGDATRPGGSGGTKRSFDRVDNSNSALRKIATPAGMMPRGTTDAPYRTLGSAQTAPSSKRALLMTGAGPGKEGRVARFNTGMGGMSNAAFKAIEHYAPTPNGSEMKMPGQKEQIHFGQHAANSEWGVPSFTGFGTPNQQMGVTMFRTGGVDPGRKTRDGLMFSGYDARPTELDSQRAIHGAPNPDPRNPGTIGGPNGPPLVSAMTPSRPNANGLTEKKPMEEVNAVIQKGHIVRPFAPTYNPDDNYAQWMVIHRAAASLNAQAGPKQLPGPRSGKLSGAQFRYTQMSITSFNYLLASSEMAPADLANELGVLDLWRNWEIDGLVINEVATSVVNTANRTVAAASERLVNICNAGPARSFNYFGNAAKKSNVIVGFIVKRVPRAELSALTQGRPFKDEARREIARQQNDLRLVAPVSKDTIYYKLSEKKDYLAVYSRDNLNRPLHPSPFQMVPFATDSFMGPSLKDLHYKTANGADAYGIWIECAQTVYPITQGHSEDAIAGMIDESRLASAGQLHVHVNIETHI